MRLSTNVNNNIGFNGQATNVTVTLIIVQSVTTLATKVPTRDYSWDYSGWQDRTFSFVP